MDPGDVFSLIESWTGAKCEGKISAGIELVVLLLL